MTKHFINKTEMNSAGIIMPRRKTFNATALTFLREDDINHDDAAYNPSNQEKNGNH